MTLQLAETQHLLYCKDLCCWKPVKATVALTKTSLFCRQMSGNGA